MKKLAILGASYLQVPLIKKAKELGIETHVFAWENGALGKKMADFFYPISILEKNLILKKCKEIEIDGITTIATDIAMPAVNYIADQLNLIGNSLEATLTSTDKFEMRKALSSKGVPCPKFAFYNQNNFINKEGFQFPIIVKPTDRSGSRGVTKVYNVEETNKAIMKALENSINNRAIVEEFINSEREFSVEFISFEGNHYPLAITDKVTTREPFFTERAHHQPASLDIMSRQKIYSIVIETLNALGIKYGASHTELYLLNNGDVRIVECAGRMGGDFIGSHMVELSTGFDFLAATIDASLNQFEFQKYLKKPTKPFSGVYYVIAKPGKIKGIFNHQENFEDVVYCEPLMSKGDIVSELIDGADKRSGIIVYSSCKRNPFENTNNILEIITE